MRFITPFTTGILALAGALQGQNIVGQYSVPFSLNIGVPLPYVGLAQFYTPDGAGALLLFNPPDDSLHRFDSSGKELWSASLSFGSLQGAVTGMAVAADGIYLGGQMNGALPGQTGAGNYDAFAVKYDLSGKTLWTTQFGTSDGDFVRAIAVAPDGVYILGVSAPSNFFIRKTDANGNEIWTRRYKDATLGDIEVAAADVTGVYFFGPTPLIGARVVRKFDSAGNDLWTHRLDVTGTITGIAPDGQGVYVAFLGPNVSVRRLDLTGSEVWTREYGPTSYSTSIAADTSGFYLSGVASNALSGQCYAGQGDVFLMRFGQFGDPLWTREFGAAGFDRRVQVSIGASEVDVSSAQSSSGAIYLTRLEKSSAPVTDSKPRIEMECVLNSGSYLGGGVAPGEIVTILGSNMGPADVVKLQPTSDGRIPTSLAGARILFNGEPAPLAQQSSAIVPYDVAGKSTVDVQVEYNGVQSAAVTVPVFDSRLGVFSYGPNGSGQAAIINEDGTINSSFNPAARGSVVSIYATGAGLPDPPGADDQITPGNPPVYKSTIYIRLESDGSCDYSPSFLAEVLYYGGVANSVPGLVQINAKLPLDVPPGDAVPLYFLTDPNSSTVEQSVTIAIQ
ncbi:MAG TPA: hypothetical protein VH639_13555 [Bryobacteraceae bacterium]|jgi:uncharacterized protein (TIGR03437 family)